MRTSQMNHRTYTSEASRVQRETSYRQSYTKPAKRSASYGQYTTKRTASNGNTGKAMQRMDDIRSMGYVDGNTVLKPDYDIVKEMQKKPIRRVSKQTRKNREKATKMNLGQVAFLVASMFLTSVILFQYLALQTANTASVKEIARMESALNSMRLENDEEYSRIMGSVDLEEVKERAINELGMQYAEEGQVVEVESTVDDYVRQYIDMP